MKLSNRKQLLSEADAELKRMRKLAGLTEGKKPLLIEEFMEGTDALIAAVNAILDGLLILTKRGVDTDGTPLPTTFDREKAIKIITKHQNNIISKIKSNQITDFDDVLFYMGEKIVPDMKKLGFRRYQ